jgi:hypothetical protein
MGLSGLMEGGYDVECYCGWASKTGGAIKARVAEALTHHRLHEQWKAENGWQGLDDAEIGRRITAQLRQEENAKGAGRPSASRTGSCARTRRWSSPGGTRRTPEDWCEVCSGDVDPETHEEIRPNTTCMTW